MTTTETKTTSCKARWASEKNDRMRDLRKLWRAYSSGNEDVPDIGNLYEYGLGFDYVAPGTFTGQRRGYWRWQLSWGGPSDEFTFYADGPHAQPDRIAYSFKDWFDGYERKLTGKDEALLIELWDWFKDCGSTESAYNEATA